MSNSPMWPISRRAVLVCFLLVLLIKVSIAYWYAQQLFCKSPEYQGGLISVYAGDATTYIAPMENYINHGEFFFINQNGNKILAGRAPHYSIPYLLLRKVFDRPLALDLLVVLQILIEIIASFLVSSLVFKITQKKIFFYLSLLFSVLSLYVLNYSIVAQTDSISTSLLFISFYFLVDYLANHLKYKRKFFIFCVIISYLVFLRPYFALMLPFVFLYVFVKEQYKISETFRHAAAFMIPFCVFLLPWAIRNYYKLNQFIPFQQDIYAGSGYSKEDLFTRELLGKLGEDGVTVWEWSSAASYFSKDFHEKSKWSIPKYMRDKPALYHLIEKYKELRLDNVHDSVQRYELFLTGNSILKAYKETFPFRYYLGNYLHQIYIFLIHSGSHYFSITPGCNQRWEYSIKILQSLMYHALLVFGTAGLLLLARKQPPFIIFILPSFVLIITFVIIFRLVEWRYFLPFYNFHQVGLFYLFYLASRKMPRH